MDEPSRGSTRAANPLIRPSRRLVKTVGWRMRSPFRARNPGIGEPRVARFALTLGYGMVPLRGSPPATRTPPNSPRSVSDVRDRTAPRRSVLQAPASAAMGKANHRRPCRISSHGRVRPVSPPSAPFRSWEDVWGDRGAGYGLPPDGARSGADGAAPSKKHAARDGAGSRRHPRRGR